VSSIYLAVVGAGIPDPESDALAEEVGRAIAEHGAYLVCGGLEGVMEAACRGAKSAGGTTIAILPTLDRSAANPYVDYAIPTGMGEMRNALVVRSADAVIAIGGEFGTLSEIAFALKTGKPVIGLRTWDLAAAKPGLPAVSISVVETPRVAVDEALRLAGEH
jgi:hypothetical protein